MVVDFTVDKKAKPLTIEVVSSEEPRLNLSATTRIKTGEINIGSPNVKLIAEGKYRATISFPLEGAQPPRIPPKEIGSRTVVVDFTVDKKTKPLTIEVSSSEAPGLNPYATMLIKTQKINIGSPGVKMVAEGKYRAIISFPLEGDSAPLPAEITPPKGEWQPGPTYPFELARADIAGGALFKLTIDEQGNIKNTELVRASHKAFGTAALNALKKWHFEQPAKKNGLPVEITLFQLFIYEVTGKPTAPWPWQMTPEPALSEFRVTGSFVRID